MSIGILTGPENPLQNVDLVAKMASGNPGDIIVLNSAGEPVAIPPIGVATSNIGINNLIINGCCRVAQRPYATFTNGVWTHGAADRFDGIIVGVTGSGFLSQITALGLGRTNYGICFQNITLDTGTVVLRHRIESKDAQILKNQVASFSCMVHHDVGNTINARIALQKPAVTADTFTSLANITESPNIPVLSSTPTLLKFEAMVMGDCSKGIEITIFFLCGSVTDKYFYITDIQLELGVKANPIVIPSYAQVLAHCMRYCWAIPASSGIGYALTAQITYSNYYQFLVPMRVAPTLLAGSSYVATAGSNGTPALNNTTPSQGSFYNADNNWSVNAYIKLNGAILDAEFAA